MEACAEVRAHEAAEAAEGAVAHLIWRRALEGTTKSLIINGDIPSMAIPFPKGLDAGHQMGGLPAMSSRPAQPLYSTSRTEWVNCVHPCLCPDEPSTTCSNCVRMRTAGARRTRSSTRSRHVALGYYVVLVAAPQHAIDQAGLRELGRDLGVCALCTRINRAWLVGVYQISSAARDIPSATRSWSSQSRINLASTWAPGVVLRAGERLAKHG